MFMIIEWCVIAGANPVQINILILWQRKLFQSKTFTLTLIVEIIQLDHGQAYIVLSVPCTLILYGPTTSKLQSFAHEGGLRI